jgi:hypothetical protein
MILGDSLRLQQVLLNLAGNAIKFTFKGEVVIGVRKISDTPESIQLEFYVRDTGIGIPKEKQSEIFGGFTQAEASTSRRFGGTGLGLAISQRLVRLMGGELTVDSEPGHGSEFRFSVGFLQDTSVAPSRVPEAQSVQPLLALIVDDNPTARDILSSMVNSLGWKAVAVSGGAEAIAHIEARLNNHFPYDVVFMDWRMPEMDGWETAQRIRKLRHGDRVPVIIMVTAHSREMLVERQIFDTSVLDGFLVKPVTASMLFDAVADATSGRSARSNVSVPGIMSLRRLSGLRLLVVEDNLTNRQVAQELLEGEGAYVEVASGGRECLDLIARADPPFSAVLMDIQMPDMDGYATTREIRQAMGLTSLPIIAMTANALPADREISLSAGMNEHIGKPIDVEVMVNTLLGQCGMGSTPPRATEIPSLASLSGISSEETLLRLGGNRALYARLARNFRSEQGDMVNRVKALTEEADKSGALEILHTLKGVASTLGARSLAGTAAEAEEAIHLEADRAHLDSIVERLGSLMIEACESLEILADQLDPMGAGSAKSAEPDAQPDIPATMERMKIIEYLLVASNLRALDEFTALWNVVSPALKEQMSPLREAIFRLDFSDALEKSRHLRELLGHG